MYLVQLTASKKAPQRNPYLARLSPAGREWAVRQKWSGSVDAFFIADATPGDIFECRGYIWDDDEKRYAGGTYWFTLGRGGEIVKLDRDVAMERATTPRLVGNFEPTDLPMSRAAYPTVPDRLVRAELAR